ncbi:MAG TPA: NAD-dependent succinate-semialdehyde dehydrogenase [Thermoanaerobaculia bacterium]|nr:NAD-dependent succinate-semialdehyde dehydrogenase [Thermoanaerobaculia bacterium]
MPETTRSVDPHTEETIAEYPVATESEVAQALDGAVATQLEWRSRPFAARAAALEEVAGRLLAERDQLAELCTREMGKLIGEARAEVEKCASVCRYYVEHAERQLADEALDDDDARRSFVARQPLGVVLAVMPWNFPYWQVFRCAVPALMAGNTVVLKHAGNVTGCSLAIERTFRDIPGAEGILRSIVLDGERAGRLIDDRRVAAVSLTGSTGAGRAIGAAAGGALKPSVLELGGSDPFVVLDLEHEGDVIENAVRSRYQNCGQSCIAAKRFIVLREVYDRFVGSFVARASELAPGDPLDPATTLAPLARRDLRDEVGQQVEGSRRAGATVALGGEVPARTGWFYPATVLLHVQPGAPAYSEEVFGPVATIFRVEDDREAVELANDSPFGLGGSVWCGDAERALAVARAIDSGAVYVNRMMASDPRLPFGGIKHSGYGRELSHLGIREFVNEKTISVALEPE